MADVTRRIGLSLGADLCWPICYEEILKRLKLAIPVGGDTVRFEVDRVTIEPFDLRQPVKYDVVIDRLTHWYHTSREWIKKGVVMNDLYVFNNPWSVQSMEKHTSYCAMMKLGMPIPETWMVPPKSYEPTPDLKPTLVRYAKLFDLAAIGKKLGYPLFKVGAAIATEIGSRRGARTIKASGSEDRQRASRFQQSPIHMTPLHFANATQRRYRRETAAGRSCLSTATDTAIDPLPVVKN